MEDWWVFENPLRFKVALVVFRKKQRASSPLANPWVKAGSSPHKKPQLRCWRRPLMVRHPYSEAVWAPSRAVGTSLVPWGEKGLEKAVDPPLRVREDWWVFEDSLRFKEVLVVFRRFKKLLLFFRMSRLQAFKKPLLMLTRFFESLFKPYFLKNSIFLNYK